MMLVIKKLLYVRNVEDYFGHKYIFNIIILCFLTFLSIGGLRQRLMAHLFTLLWISINTCQLYTLFKRKNCDFIFCESHISDDSRYLMFLKGSILENMIFGVFIMVHLVFFMHANIYITLIITVVHFSFAIAIGAFCGQLSNRFLGLILIVLFYGCCFFNNWWTTDEPLRFMSPTIQLYNLDIINVTNTCSLIILTIILIILAKYLSGVHKKYRTVKIMGLIGLCIILFSGIIYRELSINKKIEESAFSTIIREQTTIKFKGVDEQTATVMANLLIDLENELTKLGIESQSKEYQIKKYYISYLHSLYKTRPIPITKDEDIIYINIFSDAMTNFKEDELIRDFIDRAYNQMVEIYDIDNNYVYQIVEGCRAHVYKSAFEKNLNIYSKDLVQGFDKEIEKRATSATTQYNFLKKIVNYMFDKYPRDIPKLYSLVQSELPKNNEEFIEILEENFPESLEESEIQKIIKSVNRSK